MTLDYDKLLADLRHESDGLAELLTTLTYEQWGWPTPARGWGIQDQVSHLAFFDDSTVLALTDPGEFRTQADKLMADGMDFPDRIAKNHRILTPETLLDWFVEARRRLLAAIAVDDPKRRIPWFGPEMSIASSATARLMETWAHSQDIYDTLGIAHPPSPGLRSIAHLGVATVGFAHTINGVEAPGEPIRVELRSPDGEPWIWGPDDASECVAGTAEDFVLVVTQRKHWAETGLVAAGSVAAKWLDIAQAFAGAPTRRERPAVRP